MATTLTNRPLRHGETAPVIYERQVGGALAGIAAIIVGAWGAICGYIGPYFGFRPVTYRAWTGSLQEGLLHVAPGAAAIVAGFLLLAVGPARRRASRFAFTLPAVLLLAAGAWFVIGPVAWPSIEPGVAFLPAHPLRNLLDVACASYAPGLVLVMLGGMALKALTVPPVAVEDPMIPAEAAPVATAAPVTTVAPASTVDDPAGRRV